MLWSDSSDAATFNRFNFLALVVHLLCSRAFHVLVCLPALDRLLLGLVMFKVIVF